MDKFIDKDILENFILIELDGQSAIFNQLIHHFQNNIRAELKAAQTALQKNDLQSIAQLAHKLKPSCTSFGALPLKDKLFAIEMSAKKNDQRHLSQMITDASNCAEKTFSTILVLSMKILPQEP